MSLFRYDYNKSVLLSDEQVATLLATVQTEMPGYSLKFKAVQFVVEVTEYTCDILRKELPLEMIHSVIEGHYCVSKEAYQRLPIAFREPSILKAIAKIPSGPAFQPECLAEGIFVLSPMCLKAEADREVPGLNHDGTFHDLESAIESIKQDSRMDGTTYLFQDGKLIKAFTKHNVCVLTDVTPKPEVDIQ